MGQSSRFAVLWKQVIHNYFQRELLTILLWGSLGTIAAAFVRALLSDHAFDAFLIATYLPPPSLSDEPARYIPYLVTAAIAAAIFILIKGWQLVVRGLKSWALGVTSGLKFISFSSTAILLCLTSHNLLWRLSLDLAIIFVSFVLACIFRRLATSRNSLTPDESTIRVNPQKSNPVAGPTGWDEAITTWSEDRWGRAPTVENLARTILIAKAPVVALFGNFGSGKTSILNLLRLHLKGKVIAVSFSTWLPGSEQTLTSYLMADIATECQKEYMVPGLRRSATRLAAALAQSISFLKGLTNFLPSTTQRDDIENLGSALRLLPQRVVVLLDELDRMEGDELRTLMKVIRGISQLPNLTFVCAAEKEMLIKLISSSLIDDGDLYFEKFFPVQVPVPKIGDSDLQNAGTDRLIRVFDKRKWFDTDVEKESFRKQINEVWTERIRPFCRTPRAIGLLANDVDVAAAPMRREVDPIDLVLVEVLRRFKYSVYEVVANNSIVLTGGDSWIRGGSYRSDEEKKTLGNRLISDLKAATKSDVELEYVKDVLNEMFPRFAEIDGRQAWILGRSRTKRDNNDKRISQPDMFPAYFRYELPAGVYSSVEFAGFARRFTDLPDDLQRRAAFVEELLSMEKGSVKRDDFLKKVSDEVSTAELSVARAWTLAAIVTANEIAYEGFFFSLSEAGHVLRMVIRYGQRLPQEKRTAFLSECIDNAADDTMAFRIITLLTDPRSDGYLGASFAELYPAFIQRMRKRYGRDVDASRVDLTTSDPPSFNMWGMHDFSKSDVQPDPEDREIQHDFWKRYIGHNKGRLIRLFNEVFMPDKSIYQSDPEPFVENKVSVELVRKLFTELPDDFDPNEVPKRYVNRLKRFLRGDFKNGIGVEMIDNAGTLPEENEVEQ